MPTIPSPSYTNERPLLRWYLYEYGSTSPADWATNNMYDVVAAFVDQCNLNQLIGDASGCGPVLINGPTIWIRNGAGLDHTPAPLDQRTQAGGVIFLRPDGDYREDGNFNDYPVFSMGGNSTLKCFALYSDRLAEMSTTGPYSEGTPYNFEDYPTISGGPNGNGKCKAYAPFVVADFTRESDGTRVASDAGQSIDFLALDVQVNGANTIAYLHEANPSVETWSYDASDETRTFTHFVGSSSGGHTIRIRGLPMERGVVLGRCAISPQVQLDIGAQNWVTGSGAGSSNTVLYTEKNLTALVIRSRCTGGSYTGKIRNAACGMQIEAGTAPTTWATLAATQNPGYPSSHPDNGKYASLTIDLGFETTPTGLRIMPDAFIQNSSISLNGAFNQRDDRNNTSPVIDERSDATVGGVLIYKKNNGSPTATWTPMGNFNSSNMLSVVTIKQAGPLFMSTSATSPRHWAFIGGKSTNFCIGDASPPDDDLYNVIYDADTGITLSFDDMTFSAGGGTGKSGGDLIFGIIATTDAVALRSLDLSDIKYYGYADPAAPSSNYPSICARRPTATAPAVSISDFSANGVFHPTPEYIDNEEGTVIETDDDWS